jgi:hypothetical protein
MRHVNTITALVGVMAVALAIAVIGLCLQIAWVGQPVGNDGAWVGDVSAGFYSTALIATFVLAVVKRETPPRR